MATNGSNAPKEATLTWIQWIVIAAIAISIVVTIFLTPGVTKAFSGVKHLKTAGEYGDMFGSVNALFSGFAFLGVIVAIFLQCQELRLQREELSDTREVLTEQRKEMTLQNEALRKQQFESMFFQMVSLHNQIVNDLDYTDRKPVRGSQIAPRSMMNRAPTFSGQTEVVRGRDVFEVLYKQLKSLVMDKKEGFNSNTVRAAYNEFYQKNSADLGHYFRNLYNVVKYVHRHAGSHREDYFSIIRAQLSSFELVLLHYNCWCGMGRGKFQEYVLEHNLLEHLEKDLLMGSRHDAKMEPNASGE